MNYVFLVKSTQKISNYDINQSYCKSQFLTASFVNNWIRSVCENQFPLNEGNHLILSFDQLLLVMMYDKVCIHCSTFLIFQSSLRM